MAAGGAADEEVVLQGVGQREDESIGANGTADILELEAEVGAQSVAEGPPFREPGAAEKGVGAGTISRRDVSPAQGQETGGWIIGDELAEAFGRKRGRFDGGEGGAGRDAARNVLLQ